MYRLLKGYESLSQSMVRVVPKYLIKSSAEEHLVLLTCKSPFTVQYVINGTEIKLHMLQIPLVLSSAV